MQSKGEPAQIDEDSVSKYICPVTMVEMNAKQPFVVLRTTGWVLSERALKEIGIEKLQVSRARDLYAISDKDLGTLVFAIGQLSVCGWMCTMSNRELALAAGSKLVLTYTPICLRCFSRRSMALSRPMT